MKEECAQTVRSMAAAAGKKLSDAQLQDMHDRVIKARQILAKSDPDAWRAMSSDERTKNAGELATRIIQREAAEKKARIALNIKAAGKIDKFTSAQMSNNPENWRRQGWFRKLFGGQKYNDNLDSIDRYVNIYADGKTNGQSMESRAGAMHGEYQGQLARTWEASKRNILGLRGNPIGGKALLHEIRGENSTEKMPGLSKMVAETAKDGAAGFVKVARQAFDAWRRFGGITGDLGDEWHNPQGTNNWRSILRAGWDTDTNKELPVNQFVEDHMQWIDQRGFVNDDGTLMNDDDLRGVLKTAWETKATGGALKNEPGVGRGAMANRRSGERIIPYKDTDSQYAAIMKYGHGDVQDVLDSHLKSMAKDTASLEYLGTNPKEMMRLKVAEALQRDIARDKGNRDIYEAKAQDIMRRFDYQMQGSPPPVSKFIAAGFDMAKDYQTICKMGTAPITATQHFATMFTVARQTNTPYLKMIETAIKNLNPLDHNLEHQVQVYGLALDHMKNGLGMWGKDYFGPRWSKRLANGFVRGIGLEAGLDNMRNSYAVVRYGKITQLAMNHETMDSLPKVDLHALTSKGITPENWSLLRMATEEWGDQKTKMITPESIYAVPDEKVGLAIGNNAPQAIKDAKRDAILKMMGGVNEEMDNAVIRPHNNERYSLVGQFDRGTIRGNLAASAGQFLSVPLTQMRRNWNMAWNAPDGASKALCAARYIAATMLIGATVRQTKNVLNGNDPEKMNSLRFGFATLLDSAMAGTYLDTLLNPNGTDHTSLAEKLDGPLIGTLGDIYKIGQMELNSLKTGQSAHVGEEAMRLMKNDIPFVHAFYTKQVFDRMIYNQAQDLVTPGSTARTIERAKRNGVTQYWPANKALPTRAPDFSKAIQ